MKKQKGFTLIEILIVVAIIGVITSIVMVYLNSGKEKAVGIKSITELDQLKKAIELYRTDMGKYPGEGDDVLYYTKKGEDFGNNLFSNNVLTVNDFFKNELVDKGYISSVPYYVGFDVGNGNDFLYTTNSDFLKYKCGGQTFSSYLIMFLSLNKLQFSTLDDFTGSTFYYCFGQ